MRLVWAFSVRSSSAGFRSGLFLSNHVCVLCELFPSDLVCALSVLLLSGLVCVFSVLLLSGLVRVWCELFLSGLVCVMPGLFPSGPVRRASGLSFLSNLVCVLSGLFLLGLVCALSGLFLSGLVCVFFWAFSVWSCARPVFACSVWSGVRRVWAFSVSGLVWWWCGVRPLQTQTHTQARDAPNCAKKSPKPRPAGSKTLPWAPQHSPKPVNRFQNGSKRAQKSSWAPRNGFQHVFSRTHGKSCETSTVDSVLKKKTPAANRVFFSKPWPCGAILINCCISPKSVFPDNFKYT